MKKRSLGTSAARSEESFVSAPAAGPQPRSGRTRAASPHVLSRRWAPRRPRPAQFFHQRHVRAAPCPGRGQGRPGQSPCRGRGWAGPQPRLPLLPSPAGAGAPWGALAPPGPTSCHFPRTPGPGRPPGSVLPAAKTHAPPQGSPGEGERGCGDAARPQRKQRSVEGEAVSGGSRGTAASGSRLKNASRAVRVALVEVKDELKVEKAIRKREA